MSEAPAGERHPDRGNRVLRRADRWIGIPAVATAGLARRLRGRHRVPADPRVVGLLKASGIGDTVLLSGVVRDLRAGLPDARIVLFTSANNDAFARLLDGPDAVVDVPVRNPVAAVRLVRAEALDVMIDFGMWPRFEALVASLSGARCVIGARTPGQHRHLGFDVVVEHSTDHEVENYRHLVAPLGVRSTTDPVITRGTDAPRPVASPYVVLHLWPGGSNSEERSWPLDRWHALARELAARGYEVVLTGGPGDAPACAALLDAWVAEGMSVHSAAGASPLECVAWLRHAAGVVSVNTGVMHLGAAVGTPVLALNGPTSARRWGPIGPHTRCVASPMVPDGYLNLGWERDDRYRGCMAAITVPAVTAAWDDLMAEVSAAP